MKKIALFLVLVMFSASASFAMVDNVKAKGGLNFSNSSNSDLDQYDLGFSIGAGTSIPVADKTNVCVDILYASKKAKGEILGQDISYTTTYIEVPFVVNYEVAENIGIFGGAYLGYLLSAEIEAAGNTKDLKDDTESLDYGIIVGGSYAVDAWTITGQYALGLQNIAKAEGSDERKLNSITVAASYAFPLK